jgi:hypothetical protein
MREEFVKTMDEFVRQLLNKENLVTKKVGGQDVKCRELFTYIKKFTELFKDGKMPEVKSMFEVIDIFIPYEK